MKRNYEKLELEGRKELWKYSHFDIAAGDLLIIHSYTAGKTCDPISYFSALFNIGVAIGVRLAKKHYCNNEQQGRRK